MRSIGFFVLALIQFNLVSADAEHFYASPAYETGDLGGWPQQLYKSSPVIGPVLNYMQKSEQCYSHGGYTMITPRGNSVPMPGPMIVDDRGNLVWTKNYGRAYDLKVQQYRGEDYLTFWIGKEIDGYGNGSHYMVTSTTSMYRTCREQHFKTDSSN